MFETAARTIGHRHVVNFKTCLPEEQKRPSHVEFDIIGMGGNGEGGWSLSRLGRGHGVGSYQSLMRMFPMGVPFSRMIRREDDLVCPHRMREAGQRHLMTRVQRCKKGVELRDIRVVGYIP